MPAPQLTQFINGRGQVTADNLNSFQQTCDTFAQLRAFIGTTGIQVFCRGGVAIGDGLQGDFFWDATSTATDDGFNIIVPIGAGAIGRWIRISPGPVTLFTVDDFGARGDGVTDDTVAFQRALTATNVAFLTGNKTYYCASTITLLSGQTITGFGSVKTGATNAIAATGATQPAVLGVGVIAAGSTGRTAITFTDCVDARVEGCAISNHRLYGVLFNGVSSGCVAAGNHFTDAAITPVYGVPGGTDIGIEQNAQNCQAINNMCEAGNGSGVQVRNYRDAGPQHCDYHNVHGNTVIGYFDYGILLYRDGPYSPDVEADISIYGCSVTGNVIKDISGARPNTPGGSDYIFGSGIYIQGAEHTTVTGNAITNTHTANQVVLLLAPGSIGLANVGDVTICGNSCWNDPEAGIFLNNQNLLGDLTGGSIVISGNTIVKAGTRGIYANSNSNIVVVGNSIDAAGTSQVAILIDRGSSSTNTMVGLVVADNRIRGFSGTGVSINWTTSVHIVDNQINMSTGDAINVGNGADFYIAGNRMTGYTRGVLIGSTITGVCKIINNQIVGNGSTSTNGIIASSASYIYGNVVSGHTSADYSGTFAPGGTLPDTTTPTITGYDYAMLAPAAATSITNFTGGVIGQVVTLRANNGNVTLVAGSLLLNGNSNFAMANGAAITLRQISATPQWLEIGRKT